MAENLNYEINGSFCYNDSIMYCDEFGRIYNWKSAQNACPQGWHLPSKEEWEQLSFQYEGNEKNAYSHLIEGGNSGFNAKLGGYSFADGTNWAINRSGSFWSNTEINSFNVWYYILVKEGEYGYSQGQTIDKKFSFYIRCIKNK